MPSILRTRRQSSRRRFRTGEASSPGTDPRPTMDRGGMPEVSGCRMAASRSPVRTWAISSLFIRESAWRTSGEDRTLEMSPAASISGTRAACGDASASELERRSRIPDRLSARPAAASRSRCSGGSVLNSIFTRWSTVADAEGNVLKSASTWSRGWSREDVDWAVAARGGANSRHAPRTAVSTWRVMSSPLS